eukprot:TRINITY_DN97471_c0_g1_i1.p1 TRINITY_DN97471_c0_g1~~TRINITY_DN97471_c0_g1_i1.p1  ORF type:complete len:494 (+),score=47.92 TRINITY_DN97471_c0_g1_i1:113-1594(+)
MNALTTAVVIACHRPQPATVRSRLRRADIPLPRRPRRLQLLPAGITAVLEVVYICTVRSNTRAQELPKARRQRARSSSDKLRSASAGKSGDEISSVMFSPSSPTLTRDNAFGRSAKAGAVRHKIKKTKTKAALFRCVTEACSNGCAEASIFGAAMQHCGNRRWWDILLKLQSYRREIGIKTGPVQLSIFLSALRHCARGPKFGMIDERRDKLLQLAKEAWSEAERPLDAKSFNVVLGAALRLCTAARDENGLSWGRELWEWIKTAGVRVEALPHGLYAVMLESYKQRSEVDEMIADAASACALWLDDSFLGEMLECAASMRDWRRADVVWHKLVKESGVQPTIIAFCGWSKVHMLCGRVLEAAQILDEADSEALNGNFKAVIDRAQLLVLICHSSPTQGNLHRLRNALDRGDQTIEQGNNRHAASEWRKVKFAAQRFGGDITALRLNDVLVEWKASTQSVMKHWENHPGGSQYLGHSYRTKRRVRAPRSNKLS